MKYYQLKYNRDNHKMRGVITIGDFFIYHGERMHFAQFVDRELYKQEEPISYRLLRHGKTIPVAGLGIDFAAFDASIDGIYELLTQETKVMKIYNKEIDTTYLVPLVFKEVDCIDWERSYYLPWEAGKVLEPGHNPRGSYFIDPVFIGDKIPKDCHIFKPYQWDSAFPTFISEVLMNKILSLDFDHSFAIFKPIEII